MVARVFRRADVGLTAAVLILATFAACDKMPLTAPTQSTIALFAAGNAVPLNGSLDLVATVTEPAGTPVHNGTLVTFTTTLGRVEPAEARTTNGRVTVRLVADGRSGTARVIAFSGPAVSDPLELPVGAAAAESIVLRADPGTLGSAGGTVQLVAVVRDASGNPVPGVPVTFSANAGQLGESTVLSNSAGEARTTLTTNRQTLVTASAGAQRAEATIEIAAAPTVTVEVTPATPVAGLPAVFTITVQPAAGGNPVQSVTIDYGDGQQQALGTGSTSASHVYRQPGTYTVTVRVRDVAGQETTQVLVIVVQAAPPIPTTLTFSPPSPIVGQTVTFTANATPPAGNPVQRYEWDFGPGTQPLTTTGNIATFAFATAGQRTVTVTVVGTEGGRGTAQASVTVN
jgi:PKD repeat protein